MPSKTRPARTSSILDAVAGSVAAAVALAIGELVSAMDDAGASLVTSVGDEFVDRFAGSLKDLAVRLFGTNDKVALVVGIVVVSMALGASLGIAARRAPWLVPAAFGAFGLVGFWAYQRAPLTEAWVGAVATLAGAASGVASLWLLLRSASPRGPEQLVPRQDDGVSAGASIAAAPRAEGGPAGGAPRRAFLAAAAVLGAGAAGSALLARRARGPDPAAELRRTATLPDPASATPVPSTQPFEASGLTPYVTPNEDFYRIDTALAIPRVDPTDWQLQIGGLVDRPFSVTFDELLALDSVVEPVTLQCVSNEIGGDLVDNARWQGVPLAHLLEMAGVQQNGTQVLGRSVDGFTAGFPTELVHDGRTALVAYAMNDELLPARHGFPARLVVAGLYGYVSATKWLSDIELTRFDEVDGYWIPRGWAKEAPVKTASRIDVPRAGATVAAGRTPVAGVAWAGDRGISAVELRVDDGPWQPCELGAAASNETWVQWHVAWDAPPGEHVLTVRATDGDGELQTDEVSSPAPDGATGRHARRVRVDS